MLTSLILPSLFLLAGAAALVFLLQHLFRAVALFIPSFDLRSNLLQKRQNKVRTQVESIEALIDAKNFTEASHRILETFIIESTPSGKYQNEFLIQNNVAVLEHAVYLLEATNTHFRNLHILEAELLSRASLLKLYAQAHETKRKIESKPHATESRKWASEDLEKKISTIEDQLKANGEILRTEMRSLVASIKSSGSSSEVTYH